MVFESRLGTNARGFAFCATLLGRGAVRAFLGAYFKIHGEKKMKERKKNFWGIKSL